MFKFVVLVALFAVAHGVTFESPLGATLLPKVYHAPAETTIVKQPVHIQQTEAVYRSVPVPYKAVAYTAPQVITPHIYANPLPVISNAVVY